jgi:hypothetical protein
MRKYEERKKEKVGTHIEKKKEGDLEFFKKTKYIESQII